MGIFGAPTILSGQDFNTFTNEVYETKRGDEPVREMDREAVDDAMLKDLLDQQSGAEIEPLAVQDIRIDHLPEFFDTMGGCSWTTCSGPRVSSPPRSMAHLCCQSTGSNLSKYLEISFKCPC